MSAVRLFDTTLPPLVRDHLARSVPASATLPATVRVRQSGEMWQRPGAKAMRFEATEDFDVARVSFAWRARFPLLGPLAGRSSVAIPACRSCGRRRHEPDHQVDGSGA
jgi:hypothetical protein